MINPTLNRKLHALASGIAPGEAHEFLRQQARQRYGCGYKELNELQCRELVSELRTIKNRMRRNIYQALNGAETEVCSEEQIAQARQFQRLLGWEDYAFNALIKNRYGEQTLELMPKWKAFRLIAYLQKRWRAKQKSKRVCKELQ